MTNLTETQKVEIDAYWAGRNAIDDDGSLIYECPLTSQNLIDAWRRGVRDIRSELRLNADTEWD